MTSRGRRRPSGQLRPSPDAGGHGDHLGPRRDDEHEIKYFRRHHDDDPQQPVPGQAFLRGCDVAVRAKLRATLVAVAAAPPHKFAGGGYWEAMHGSMTGWFEVRRHGRDRSQYRLFCLVDLEAAGARKPWLVVITGLSKPWRTTFSEADYGAVRELGNEYRKRNPRSVI